MPERHRADPQPRVLVWGPAIAKNPWLSSVIERAGLEPVRCTSATAVGPEQLDRFGALLIEVGGEESEPLESVAALLSSAAKTRTLLVLVRPAWSRVEEAIRLLGMCDFVRMPVSADELTLRIRMRTGMRAMPENARGPLDRIREQLTRQEDAFLRELVLANGAVVSRRELVNRLWRSDLHAGRSTGLMNVYVRALRKKLERFTPELRLVTQRGRGYALIIDGGE